MPKLHELEKPNDFVASKFCEIFKEYRVYLLFVVKSLSHIRLFCNPMGYNPPGSSVHGILQARILERVAMSFCRGSS